MSGFSTEEKVNLLFKKLLGKPSTADTNPYFQEPSKISTTDINIRPAVITSKQLYLDDIPATAPSELTSATLDDNGNNIEGSTTGKSSNNTIIKKYVKLPLIFVPGSAVGSSPHSAISFYLPELQNAIPFNYDPVGSYLYELYKNDGSTTINYGQGEWVIDPEGGILTFYDTISGVTSALPPKITFYKYNGTIGLYPISFTSNKEVNIANNLNVNSNINIENNINIKNDLYISTGLVFNNININQVKYNINGALRYEEPNLKAFIQNSWKTISFTDSNSNNNNNSTTLNYDIVSDPSNGYILVETHTNILLKFTSNMTENIIITLNDSNSTVCGTIKHVLVHKSFDTYNNGYKLYINIQNALDVDGNGISSYTVKLKSSGQSIKCAWIYTGVSDTNYWQILEGNFD